MYSFVFRFACSLIAQVLGVVGSFPTSCLSIWMSWVVLQQQETLSPCCLSLFQLPGECCAIQVSAQMNALLWLYTLEAYKAKAALLHSERIRPPFRTAVPLHSRTPRTARSLPPWCVPRPFVPAGNFNHASADCERFHSQTLTVASFSSLTEFILTSGDWEGHWICVMKSHGFLPFCTPFRLLQRQKLKGQIDSLQVRYSLGDELFL